MKPKSEANSNDCWYLKLVRVGRLLLRGGESREQKRKESEILKNVEKRGYKRKDHKNEGRDSIKDQSN